jgi:hypothetical protein
MQLDKVVNYHKALADPTRIRILILLADGEMKGQVLAERLSVTPATITHHTAKLREVSLIQERREKNTIYFTLNDFFIEKLSMATKDLIYRRKNEVISMKDEEMERIRDTVIRNFFTREGRLITIPAQLKKKLIVLEHIVSQLESGRKYSEKEINTFIQTYHEDYATIRREFIMHQFMFREQEIYELNPREMWTRWASLS